MSPGDRPNIPLETEPYAWLHPAGLGTVAPGEVQPVERVPALEEEPALWVDPLPARGAGRRRRPPAASARPRRPARALPATGRGWALGVSLVALGWILRRRGESAAGPGVFTDD